MDPLTAFALGSTALTDIGKMATAFAGSSLAQLQEGIANTNVQLLTQKASDEADEGKLSFDEAALDQSRTILQVQRTIGAQTGNTVARNLDPTYGSPLLLAGYTAGQGATDVAIEGARGGLGNAQALLTAAGTTAQAAGAAGQAAGFSATATQDIVSGILGVGSSTLSMLGSPTSPGNWTNLTSMAKSIGSGLNSTMSFIGS